MNRRDFFKRAFGWAGVAVAAQAMPVGQVVAALAPIIERGEATERLVVAERVFPMPNALQEAVAKALEACDKHETHWPGFTKSLYNALGVKLYPPVAHYAQPMTARVHPMHRVIKGMVDHVDYMEKHRPGFTRALYDALTPKVVGIPAADPWRWVWRVQPAGEGLDGWTHHALAVTEAGKP